MSWSERDKFRNEESSFTCCMKDEGFPKGNDPSLATCRSSQQTALRCCGQNPWCWADKEKAHKMGQVWINGDGRKWTTDEVLRSQPVVKTIVIYRTIGQSVAFTWLMAMRQPIFRWHERYPGFYTEQESAVYWCQTVIKLPHGFADSQRENAQVENQQGRKYRCSTQLRTKSY